MKRFLCGLFLFGLLFAMPECFAGDENGVEVVTENFGGGKQRKRVTFFSDFDASSGDLVCNEAGGAYSAILSGSVDVSGWYGPRSLYINVPVAGAGSKLIVIEGKAEDSPAWHLISSETYLASTEVRNDIVNILEYINNVRVCVAVGDDAAGDLINIHGEFISGGN